MAQVKQEEVGCFEDDFYQVSDCGKARSFGKSPEGLIPLTGQILAAKSIELMRWTSRQASILKLAFYWLEGQGQYLYLI